MGGGEESRNILQRLFKTTAPYPQKMNGPLSVCKSSLHYPFITSCFVMRINELIIHDN